MGIVLRLQGSLAESKTELETALQLDPNQVTAHRQLGFTLFFLGQPAAAIVEGESAVRLSPRDPFLWGAYQLLGFCRLHLGQLEQAVDALVKSRDGNPHNASTYFCPRCGALGAEGRSRRRQSGAAGRASSP